MSHESLTVSYLPPSHTCLLLTILSPLLSLASCNLRNEQWYIWKVVDEPMGDGVGQRVGHWWANEWANEEAASGPLVIFV